MSIPTSLFLSLRRFLRDWRGERERLQVAGHVRRPAVLRGDLLAGLLRLLNGELNLVLQVLNLFLFGDDGGASFCELGMLRFGGRVLLREARSAEDGEGEDGE